MKNGKKVNQDKAVIEKTPTLKEQIKDAYKAVDRMQKIIKNIPDSSMGTRIQENTANIDLQRNKNLVNEAKTLFTKGLINNYELKLLLFCLTSLVVINLVDKTFTRTINKFDKQIGEKYNG